jgi:haloalkane dehalogenase
VKDELADRFLLLIRLNKKNRQMTKTKVEKMADLPRWLDQKEFPFKTNIFATDQGKMNYVDEGEGDPIVMIHGNPGWSFEYRNIIKAKSGTNRCIAPDLIGFGLSDKPYEFDYLPESHANLVESFLAHLDLQNITLIVNDWGGPIGFNYAIKNPERIKRIVILNTFMWSEKGNPHFERFSSLMGKGLGKILVKYFNIFGKVVVKKAVGDKKKLSKNIHKHYFKHLSTPRERKGSWVFPREIIGSSVWLDQLWQKRKKILDIPVGIIWGMKDIAFKEKELNKFMSAWPNADVIRLPEVGHFPQEESPQTIINYLSKNN